MQLDDPISYQSGVGPNYEKRLAKLGIKTVRDLLWHFPSRYEDYSEMKKISDLTEGETATVTGEVLSIRVRRTMRRHMFITEAKIEDDTGTISAIWFNQPYLVRNIPKSSIISISGKVSLSKNGLQFSGPSYEIVNRDAKSFQALEVPILSSQGEEAKSRILDAATAQGAGGIGKKLHYHPRHTAGLIPIYPETRGITSRALRFFIQSILNKIPSIPEIIPEDTVKKLKLMKRGEALRKIHFPPSQENAEKARLRFAFEELFLAQLLLLRTRQKMKSLKAPKLALDLPLIKKFIASLPFELTGDQKQAIWQIANDIAKPWPMNRLLNGDVGSGKTVVATIAAMQAFNNGYQTAMLAPTEILARQHFEKISKILEPMDIHVALLVAGETKISEEGLLGKVTKAALIENLEKGKPYFVIGTHALIQKQVNFGKLGLVIVDEQHRFGVDQRAKLLKSGESTPHLLSMTATPIPRTLMLALYGDLDISLLKEMPANRKKIISRVIPPAKRKEAYDFIREETKKGRQAFVVCPRIEIPEEKRASGQVNPHTYYLGVGVNFAVYLGLDAKAVKAEYEKLSKEIFPELKVAMIHGKLRAEEKESVMKKFAEGKTDILVSTSVIEVGIDVPNATVMMIEGADRFGLAQLHQFRGRVGRGEHQSHCLLLSDSQTVASRERLEKFAATSNGFELAEQDLKLRGPGEFFGEKQSGLPDLAMRALKNLELVQIAQNEAKELLKKDPSLKTAPILKSQLSQFQKEVHLE